MIAGGNKSPSRCIITRSLNKTFQNAVLYSIKQDVSALLKKILKGGLDYLLDNHVLILPASLHS